MRTLRDNLSHLSFLQAGKPPGPQGESLIMESGKFNTDESELNLIEDVQSAVREGTRENEDN